MKRIQWSDILIKEGEILHGPAHFQVILRAQKIDPYKLDVVADIDFARILRALEEAKDFDSAYLITLAKTTREEGIESVTQIFKSHTDPNKETGSNFWLAYMMYMVTANFHLGKMTEKIKQAITKSFSEIQISWGAQHAFWHMLDNGANTEIGEKLFRDASQRVLNFEMKQLKDVN